MDTSKHTPGPWRVLEPSGIRGSEMSRVATTNDTPYVIAHVGGGNGPNGRDDNARLIAAAPDLLAALRACEEFLSGTLHYNEDDFLVRIARAALAKAGVQS